MIITREEREGFDAYHAGKALAANPYSNQTAYLPGAREDWSEGWLEADGDAMADAEYDSHQY